MTQRLGRDARSRRRHHYAALVALLSIAAPHHARAQQEDLQDTPEVSAAAGREEFVAGLRAAEALRWDQALAHFRRSYEVSPTAAALYNLATTLRALGRHVEARDGLAALLERRELERDVRAAAEQMLAEESARLAVLELGELPAAEVAVRVDGSRRPDTGERPLPLEVDAGERTLSVEHEGAEPFFWSGTLAEGDHRAIAVLLEPPPPPARWYESPIPWAVAGAVVVATAVVVVVLATGDTQLEPRTDPVLRP